MWVTRTSDMDLEGDKMLEFLMGIFNLIGSAMPLTILCFMVVFIMKGRKVKKNTIVSYIVVAVLMFFLLLRT